MPRTTFVLGAAANFGLDNSAQFPLGWQLAIRIQNQIAAELNEQSLFPQGHIGGALSCSSKGLTQEHVAAMARIENSIVLKDSIDDLVNEWSDDPAVLEVAKVCIATEILKSEASTQIRAAFDGTIRPAVAMRHARDSWFGQVLRHTNPQVRRRDVEDWLPGMRFITFNYDRYLEACLFLFLRSGQNVKEEACSNLINSLDILHTYGSLGRLSQLGGKLPFGGTDNSVICAAARDIKTYSEELESGHTQRIRDLISDSENIVFLGFGFHAQNLKLLFGEDGLPSKSRVFGTAMDMSNATTERVSRFFLERGMPFDLRPVDCHSLVGALKDEIL